ncbi:hypothetical protein [Kutzneria albida]|uniref:Uncharacterized protein n=1 Tax=Kutzneria albida DSM 43870 TaxID=1449976 RepID=W5WJ87_9PSEU|nr:hypothetical protein [Kutzneria albida]AHH98224.1 hypothetical protein KALB_4862 [Kutzneria albida DSM 43870]
MAKHCKNCGYVIKQSSQHGGAHIHAGTKMVRCSVGIEAEITVAEPGDNSSPVAEIIQAGLMEVES